MCGIGIPLCVGRSGYPSWRSPKRSARQRTPDVRRVDFPRASARKPIRLGVEEQSKLTRDQRNQRVADHDLDPPFLSQHRAGNDHNAADLNQHGADHDLDPPFLSQHGAGNDHDAADLSHHGADHDLDPPFLNH